MKKYLSVILVLFILLPSLCFSAARKPLLEIFTFSDCYNCALYTPAQYSFITAKRDSITPIKIHVDSKDPFYNASQMIRHSFYGVISVPDAYMDGWYKFYPENEAILQTAFDNAMSESCYVEIDFSASYNVATYSGTLNVVIIAEQEPGSGSYLLFCAVCTEYCDTGYGPYFDEFHYPLRYLFPNLSGSTINFSGIFPDTVNFSAPFQLDTSWFGFDINEIYFASWLQSGLSDKHVYQSENKTLAQVGIEEIFQVQTPSVFKIGNIFPNPFSSVMYIPMTLENSLKASITIFDISGREVRNLVIDKEFSTGRHEITWDGKNNNGDIVAPGMYRIEIISNDFVETKFIVKL